MCPQDQRLATKQVQTPQAVLAVAEECQPGWATRAREWSVISGNHSPHCVLVDRDAESQGNLISNPLIAKSRVSEQWLSEAGERGGSFGAQTNDDSVDWTHHANYRNNKVEE
jgi:hypothetical protein